MTRLILFELFITYYCLSTNEKILVSWQFSGPYGVTKYGSGWRKDVVNQCLEFAWNTFPVDLLLGNRVVLLHCCCVGVTAMAQEPTPTWLYSLHMLLGKNKSFHVFCLILNILLFATMTAMLLPRKITSLFPPWLQCYCHVKSLPCFHKEGHFASSSSSFLLLFKGLFTSVIPDWRRLAKGRDSNTGRL